MHNEYITVSELFERIRAALSSDGERASNEMRETLLLVCEMGLRDSRHDFGGLSSKVDALCRRYRVQATDAFAIQRMRRHCCSTETFSREELCSDCRALCRLIEAVAGVPIPIDIATRLPNEYFQTQKLSHTLYKYIRCRVLEWDDDYMTVAVDDDETNSPMRVHYSDSLPERRRDYLAKLLWRGMQINLVDCKEQDGELTADLIIVEPDYMVDISTLAACFEQYGHHPLLFTLNRLKERPNTKYTLLGNFASRALDETINSPDATMASILRSNYREKAMEYATCADFNSTEFKHDAVQQTANIRQIVDEMFTHFDRSRAVLEPSFVCEQLGISGRADLMTTDMRLLVEQKSGKNIFLERNYNNVFGGKHVEKHYVQLLLYHAIISHNFSLKGNATDIRLLYSRYALPKGLIEVETLKKLLRETLQLRNEIVATEYLIARDGFETVLPHLNAETLNVKGCRDTFYLRYLLPEINKTVAPLQLLSDTERAYLCRMMTFVAKEQLMSKVGGRSGSTGSAADLWNMPIAEKIETGNIFIQLRLLSIDKTDASSGYDMLSFGMESTKETFLPNFRTGDMVYVYSYRDTEQPDARRNMLFKGVIAELSSDRITVHLNDSQHNADVFTADRNGPNHHLFAIEHGGSDIGATAAMRSLYVLMTATKRRRQILLSQCVPQSDLSIRLSRSYDPYIDDILLRAKQAKDFFLLVGPPGTGKTSVALRHIVAEHLTDDESHRLLLTAYTNRAVDEICAMLQSANIDFVRIGGRYSCAPQFRDRLVESVAEECPRLGDLKAMLVSKRVVVGTTSSLSARPFIFSLMHFSLAIVDEAGQLTEPSIMGLLAAHTDGEPKHDCISKFILIGDYKQLPAVVQQDEQESAVSDPLLQAIGLTNCRSSLFERLVRREREQHRTAFVGVLRRQGRMHPDVAEFPNMMFYRDEQLMPVPCQHQIDTEIGYLLPSADNFDNLLKSHRMMFIPSMPCREEAKSEKVNTHEARIVAQLLQRIHRLLGQQFDAEHSVGVIVPYRNQIAMIRREIDALSLPKLSQVSIDTVERYQGSQRDIIIYSFTIHRQYQLDFLTANRTDDNSLLIDRKLNVALTRARKQMIITGNPSIVSKDPLFQQLITFIDRKGGLLNSETNPFSL